LQLQDRDLVTGRCSAQEIDRQPQLRVCIQDNAETGESLAMFVGTLELCFKPENAGEGWRIGPSTVRNNVPRGIRHRQLSLQKLVIFFGIELSHYTITTS